MANELVRVPPWDYDTSVAYMEPLVKKWVDMSEEMILELKKAKKELAKPGQRTDLRADTRRLTWATYCEDIGMNVGTAWNLVGRADGKPRQLRRIGSVVVTDEVDKIWPTDCLEGMRSLRDGMVDVCVTSPPYWKQRDYQVEGQIGDEESVQAYIESLCLIFDEVYRVLDAKGVLWLNLGDAMREKQLLGIPWAVAFALKARGWKLRSEVIWYKPAPMPDGARDRPTRAHEQLFMFTKSDRYYWDEQVMSKPTQNGDGKPREFRRGDAAHTKRADNGRPYQPRATANIRDVWEIGMEQSKTGHAATFPSKLIERPICACCRIGGIALDPFMGTGTTAVVAKRNGRHWIGFEINKAYVTAAEKRLAETDKGLPV